MVSEPLIVDLRAKVASTSGQEIMGDIIRGLSKPPGSKTLPTLLLYNERGLRLYDDITTKAQEYYLFGAEEEILRNHADEIVRVMHSHTPASTAVDDEVVLELGAG
jgi:L-histidine Nalpha-methyltransferase / hercynylcysteine S-oxide synthase